MPDRPGGCLTFPYVVPMQTVSTTIEIDASPVAVGEVLTDLSAHREWNPESPEASGEIIVGQRVTLKMVRPGRRSFTIHPIVLLAEPGVELRLLGRLPGIFSGEHCFALTSLDGGARTTGPERDLSEIPPKS